LPTSKLAGTAGFSFIFQKLRKTVGKRGVLPNCNCSFICISSSSFFFGQGLYQLLFQGNRKAIKIVQDVPSEK
jgi:hypothetical protein